MVKVITSTDNKIFKQTKKLKNKAERIKQGLFLAEGHRIVGDAVNSGAAEYIVISQSFDTPDFDVPVYKVSDKMFQSLSETETTQGILAVCRINKYDADSITGDTLIVCDGVADPGNLGTIIRTAECSGVSGILLLDGCTDPYNPKVVRSTMGSIFRVPIYFVKNIDLQNLKNYDIIATTLDGAKNLYETEFSEKTAVVIGSEARGVSNFVVNMANKRIKIPMCGNAESLNAAVAASIVMYEILRRKTFR